MIVNVTFTEDKQKILAVARRRRPGRRGQQKLKRLYCRRRHRVLCDRCGRWPLGGADHQEGSENRAKSY